MAVDQLAFSETTSDGRRSFTGQGRLSASWTLTLMVADFAMVALAMVLALRLRGWFSGKDVVGAAGQRHLLFGVMTLPAWVAMLWRSRLYSLPHIAGRLDEFRRVADATVAALGLSAVAGFLLKVYVARGWLILTGVLALVLLVVERQFVRSAVDRRRSRGMLLQPVVVVGGNLEALALGSTLAEEPWLGYRALGFATDDAETGVCLVEGVPVLGPAADAVGLAQRAGASALVIATTAIDHQESNRLTRQAVAAGLQVELSSSLCDIASTRLVVRPLGRFPVVHVERVRHDGLAGQAKRVFDLVSATTILLVLGPVLLLVALVVKATSRGPMLFRQERVGRDGTRFTVLKFRSMVDGAHAMDDVLASESEADGPLFKLRSDPRCTRVGRVMRALSIDELPQLWNVVRGHMSLVGPRPALPCEVDQWAPELHQRLRVRPGITGMWQVSGAARWASFAEYVRLDLYYVDNWSLWSDLAILAKTVPTVLFRRGTH